MAYAAVISLKRTIHQHLNSCHIVSSSDGEIMESAYKEMESIQQVLERLDESRLSSSSSKRLDALDGEIREKVHRLEDILELHESNQFLSSQSDEFSSYGDEAAGSSRIFSDLDLMEEEEISCILAAVKKMKEDYNKELDNPLMPEEEEEEEDDAADSSRVDDFGGKMIVGVPEDFANIKKHLLKRKRPDDFAVFSFVGRVGSGRTALAKIIFDGLYFGGEQRFDCGAWVSLCPEDDFRYILVSILAQIHGYEDGANNDYDPKLLNILEIGDEKYIGDYLYTCLMGKRYIIVLDDVCDTKIWELSSTMFPEESNGSLVLLTTSLMEVALFADSLYAHIMEDSDDNEFLDGLLVALFSKEKSYPPEFLQVGKTIAENCQGLNMLLGKVIIHLLKAEKTPESWNEVADKAHPIYMVIDEISELCKIQQLHNSTLDDSERKDIELMIMPLFGHVPGQIKGIKMIMFPEKLFPKMEIFSFCGMAGIGKTTLAKEIFKDPSILCRFDHNVWVRLGPKYHSKEILVDILAKIYPDINKMYLKRDMKLAKDLCTQLSNKRCLIVFDDVWNLEPLYYLEMLFPNIKGSALVTTRLFKVADFDDCDLVFKIRLLSEEESWCLLRSKVFGEESCPSKLEKDGRKIAKNCEGLPLMIVKVAKILHKAEKTLDFWNEVAKKENPVFTKVYNEIANALLPSYNNLSQHLKLCFLYMGVFPQDYKIPRVKLCRLWVAERFLEECPFSKWLLDLVDRNLVMVLEKGSNLKIKTCRLHSVFCYLSNSLAMKNKFFHAFKSYTDNSIEDIKSQRRLCIRNNTLLGIKKVKNSSAPNSIARSLLCTGPYHQFPVPIFFGSRLLRVLDALTIRFYEFPIEVLKLFHLTYLAVTCNGMLPSSISKLRKLQFLIVRKHLSIISYGAQFYLPMEIWDMKNLKHLQFMRSNLPNPNSGDDLLPNLLTLSDVSAQNFTKRILKRIRNLDKLGIQIELALDDDSKPFRCLNRISRLHRLRSLKCVVLNPKLRSKVVAPPAPLSMFPSSLRKLHLSGLGYTWEYMSIISSLPKLEVLKLTCYAFRGPMWEAYNYNFKKLKFLLIEDTDLVCWKIRLSNIPLFEHLSIKYCFKLEELPYNFLSLWMIEVVDCNPLVVNWAKKMEENLKELTTDRTHLNVSVQSSWDAHENIK